MAVASEIRSQLEKNALPKLLFDRRAQLMAALFQRKRYFLMDYYKQAALRCSDYSCPYEADEFSFSFHEFKEESRSVLIVRIGMPAPDEPHQCGSVYLCFGNEYCGDLYVISELNDAGTRTLRAMMADGEYTELPDSTADELDRVLEYYWEMNHTNGKS